MGEKSFVKNAADPEQVRTAKLKERFAKENEAKDLLWVLGDIRGRRFIWRQLEGVYENGFVSGMPDTTAFNLGEKAKAGTLLKQIMDVKPEAYITMMMEANAGEANKEEPKEKQDD